MNKVYIVPTPIGNTNDISNRSIDVLKSVSTIYAEDTRHSKHLLNILEIKTRMISLHKFNEKQREETILESLEEGDVAIISDAGTPTISDPGQYIIKFLIEKNIEIISLPGPTAITTALASSGIIFNSFSFAGFAERTKIKLEKQIQRFSSSDVLVLYESPARINKTLANILELFGDIEVVVSRELTKKFEEITRGKITSLINKEYKGEIVLLINNKSIEVTDNDIEEKINSLKEAGLTNKAILDYLLKHSELSKNDIYNILKNSTS